MNVIFSSFLVFLLVYLLLLVFFLNIKIFNLTNDLEFVFFSPFTFFILKKLFSLLQHVDNISANMSTLENSEAWYPPDTVATKHLTPDLASLSI